jgi:uncharacterized protein YndB with AHSA1/START domain
VARLQGRSEVVVDAPPDRIWEVLEDPTRLPDWVPVVEIVSEHAERERPGSLRRCEVAMGKRRGYMVERCVESVPGRRLHHAVEDDSLGFTKMFRDYSFTIELEPRENDATVVTCQTFYEPRGTLPRLMNAIMMRRRFAGVREEILRGLKGLVESGMRSAPGGNASGPSASASSLEAGERSTEATSWQNAS